LAGAVLARAIAAIAAIANFAIASIWYSALREKTMGALAAGQWFLARLAAGHGR
jgi:hypothetical protein